MGFRTLEISSACEIHIKEGQLKITSENGVAVVPIEDLNQIIRQKISNQSRALSIMGMCGAENVAKYLDDISKENIDITEALAAKDYFAYYHEGFHPTFGIHHDSQLNAFNLADDLIEPYRLDKSNEKLILPVILPVESLEGITE